MPCRVEKRRGWRRARTGFVAAAYLVLAGQFQSWAAGPPPVNPVQADACGAAACTCGTAEPCTARCCLEPGSAGPGATGPSYSRTGQVPGAEFVASPWCDLAGDADAADGPVLGPHLVSRGSPRRRPVPPRRAPFRKIAATPMTYGDPPEKIPI